MAEARELAKLHKNVVVKIPLIAEGLKAVRQLSGEGIRTNVTLCFSAAQALLAAKAGAVYISPFVGRLDDISHVGMDLVRQIVAIYKNYGYATRVLAASVRTPIHFVEAALAGAHVCTLPPVGSPAASQAPAHRHRPRAVPGGLEEGAEGQVGGCTARPRTR